MKALTAAVTIPIGIDLFFSVTVAAQTWEWQLPLPQGNELGSVDWADGDGARVASGVYFYRLRAGGVTEVKKMVLVK